MAHINSTQVELELPLTDLKSEGSVGERCGDVKTYDHLAADTSAL